MGSPAPTLLAIVLVKRRCITGSLSVHWFGSVSFGVREVCLQKTGSDVIAAGQQARPGQANRLDGTPYPRWRTDERLYKAENSQHGRTLILVVDEQQLE